MSRKGCVTLSTDLASSQSLVVPTLDRRLERLYFTNLPSQTFAAIKRNPSITSW